MTTKPSTKRKNMDKYTVLKVHTIFPIKRKAKFYIFIWDSYSILLAFGEEKKEII